MLHRRAEAKKKAVSVLLTRLLSATVRKTPDVGEHKNGVSEEWRGNGNFPSNWMHLSRTFLDCCREIHLAVKEMRLLYQPWRTSACSWIKGLPGLPPCMNNLHLQPMGCQEHNSPALWPWRKVLQCTEWRQTRPLWWPLAQLLLQCTVVDTGRH